MYMSNHFEEALLNLLRGQSITGITPRIALYLNDPGDDNSGTEIAYAGYARQPAIFSAPAASGSGLMISNTAEISFAEAAAAAGTVTHIGVVDALTLGNLWLYGQLQTPLVIQAGVSPVIRAGSIKWIFSGNLHTYYRTAALNVIRGQNVSGFSPFAALFAGDPAGAGVEFSGNNYDRIALAMTAPAGQANGTMQTENAAEVISNIASGTWGNMTHIAIMDAQANGNIFGSISLGSAYSMLIGNAAGFHAGDLKFNAN